ncbi:hypothetical protein CIHG_05419 [Coccidioides immitis H538.4]|uniref:Uncharacterized protein n=1 Tax=Coccidioides immitis H538.4 TaxID=396776 RepID=A0A0J8UL53_COCIT|nr:hypothetical protein CIHG_05419 [Coccidioides immitis H538.4]
MVLRLQLMISKEESAYIVQWHNGVGTLAVRIGHKNTPIGKRVRRREGDRDIRTHNTGVRTRPSACGKCWLGRNLRYLIPQRNQRKRSYGYGHFLEAREIYGCCSKDCSWILENNRLQLKYEGANKAQLKAALLPELGRGEFYPLFGQNQPNIDRGLRGRH